MAGEWTAIILLALGGFAFGVGWLIGLILLWSSRTWSTRDKLIGSLIVPGGLASAPLTIGMFRDPFTGTAGLVWTITLIALFVLGPIATAVYLARRSARPADHDVALLTVLLD